MIAPIADGGMGTVVRAAHERTGQLVAIKTVRAEVVSTLSALRAEIAALSVARHPALVTMVAHGERDGVPWLAMELLEGPTFDDVNASLWSGDNLADESERATRPSITTDVVSAIAGSCASASAPGPVTREPEGQPTAPLGRAAGGSIDLALGLYLSLCEGLACLHSAGFVHRDLKPANVMLRDADSPVLIDFGLAAPCERAGRAPLVITGTVQGTTAYMSPEQVRGQVASPESDLYALGCMLYETLTGRPPFLSTTPLGVMLDHIGRAPTPPSALVTGVPPSLDRLVLALLAKEPAARPQCAGSVAYELSEILGAPISVERALAKQLRPPSTHEGLPTLDALVDELAAARAGLGGVVALAAPRGAGKTRLLCDVAREGVLASMHVVAGACSPSPNGGELLPFLPLLIRIVDTCRERGAEHTRALLGGRAEALATLVPAIRSLPFVNVASRSAADAEPAGPQLLDALVDTIRAFLEEAPLALLIDDAQWIDPLSLELLTRLASDVAAHRALLVLVAFRSEPDGIDARLDAQLRALAPRRARIRAIDERPTESPDATGESVSTEAMNAAHEARFISWSARSILGVLGAIALALALRGA